MILTKILTQSKKKINIVPYDPEWPNIFKIHANELKSVLKENCIDIYHVGSTSVPGLCAKPTVDIMCVVKNLSNINNILKNIGYEPKGEFNLPLRLFFSRKQPNDINLHVVKENSGEISWNLTFQNYLRNNSEARELYAKTKLDLVNNNPDGFNIIENLFSEYTIKKGEIIRKIAKIAGFNSYRFVIISNYYEIESYKKFMNIENIDFSDKNTYHVCLCLGTEIVAVACVKFDIVNSVAVLKSIKSIDSKNKNILIEKISEWVDFHNLKLDI